MHIFLGQYFLQLPDRLGQWFNFYYQQKDLHYSFKKNTHQNSELSGHTISLVQQKTHHGRWYVWTHCSFKQKAHHEGDLRENIIPQSGRLTSTLFF